MAEKKPIKKVVKKKPATKKAAGRPSVVKDFIANDDKWQVLENYLFSACTKQDIAMFEKLSVDSILRIIKQGTKERYGQEMTYEKFRDLMLSKRRQRFLNKFLNKADEMVCWRTTNYAADNIYKLPELFADEDDNKDNSSNIIVLPASTMNVEDFNAISSQQQSDLQEKIKTIIKKEDEEDES